MNSSVTLVGRVKDRMRENTSRFTASAKAARAMAEAKALAEAAAARWRRVKSITIVMGSSAREPMRPRKNRAAVCN